MDTSLRLTALAEIQAAAASKPKQPARFEVSFYNGGALRIEGYDLPVVIDLAGLAEGNVLVANLDHDPTKRVGNFQVRNDGQTLVAFGVASAATAARDEVVNSAANGYQWQASLEVQPTKLETVKRGQTVAVNGRTFQGPLYVTRRGVLKGFAFVSHGADDDTTVSIAARRHRANRMKKSTFQQWINEMGLSPSLPLLTGEQLAALHANYCGRAEPGDDDRDAVLPLIAAAGDPVEGEKRRLLQIERATRGDGDWGEHAEQVAALRSQAIRGELSVDELLAAMRPIHAEHGNPTMSQPMLHGRPSGQATIAALCLNAGIADAATHFDEPTLEAASRMRDVGLQSILLAAASANGYPARPGERVSQNNLHGILQHAMPMQRAAAFSTFSLPSTLAATANKFLREGWEAVDQTWRAIAAVRPVRDFKTVTAVSLTGGLVFERLSPDGEIPHGQLGEAAYSNKADTYGVMLAISRTDIINDDLSALSAVPRRIGRGAALKMNDLVWRTFLDNSDFFKAGNNNVSTGAGSALSAEGLTAAELKFANQVDPDGNPLGVMPKILLIPPSLKRTALSLMNSTLLVGGSTLAPDANVWQSSYRVESSPYMENATFTGYSSAAWYLLADPAQIPVIEVVALNGRVEPTIETADTDFNTLGIQMRGYSDVGVALQEYRGGVRSAGS
ncbi:MAG: Mu-like prophage major head subunit gpT family protein [Pirellulales bacterium]|nr:Mu-like prophage major head subunit gpT family protein [Pirellulales bacterium]